MILLTRPRLEAEKTALLLGERGYETIIDPLLEIKGVSSGGYNKPHIAVFTSSNGVIHRPEGLLRLNPKVFVVGDSTAELAHAAGFKDIRSAEGDIEDLYEVIIESIKPEDGKIVHYCGEVTRGRLCQRLQTQGYGAKEQIVYKAEKAVAFSPITIEALQQEKITSALFFSPRTAKVFMEILETYQMESSLSKASALCISSAVAKPLRGKRWADIRIASQQTQSGVLDLI